MVIYGTFRVTSNDKEWNVIQLEFFAEDSTESLKEEVRKLKESNDKIRKSLFAKHGELAKNYFELNDRMSFIERHICRKSQENHQALG